MNSRLEDKLREYYKNIPEQPDCNGKERIMQIAGAYMCAEKNKLSYMEFVFCQILYMNRNMWMMQILSLLFCLAGILLLGNNLWIIAWVSSLLPLFILGGMLEVTKSFSDYVMELEMVTRFGLRQLLEARILVIGLADFICLSIVFVLSGIKLAGLAFYALVYMSVPFVITMLLCTVIMNNVMGKESKILMILIGVSVSILTARFSFFYPQIYRESMFKIWCLFFVFLNILLVLQIIKLLRKSQNRLDRMMKIVGKIVED